MLFLNPHNVLGLFLIVRLHWRNFFSPPKLAVLINNNFKQTGTERGTPIKNEKLSSTHFTRFSSLLLLIHILRWGWEWEAQKEKTIAVVKGEEKKVCIITMAKNKQWIICAQRQANSLVRLKFN